MKKLEPTISRRGIVIESQKRQVCHFCREYIMPGHCYRFSDIDPQNVTIRSLYAHITCADKRGIFSRGEGEGEGVTDAQILRFWKDMEALEERRREGGVNDGSNDDPREGRQAAKATENQAAGDSSVETGGAAEGRNRKGQK
jgi:hypothetical protein